jgi:hypothetical protein
MSEEPAAKRQKTTKEAFDEQEAIEKAAHEALMGKLSSPATTCQWLVFHSAAPCSPLSVSRASTSNGSSCTTRSCSTCTRAHQLSRSK